MLDYHNFMLSRYFSAEAVDFQQTLDELRRAGRARRSRWSADVSVLLRTMMRSGANVLFEGAQGALLDIDVRHLSVRDVVEHDRRRSGRRAPASARATFTACSAS